MSSAAMENILRDLNLAIRKLTDSAVIGPAIVEHSVHLKNLNRTLLSLNLTTAALVQAIADSHPQAHAPKEAASIEPQTGWGITESSTPTFARHAIATRNTHWLLQVLLGVYDDGHFDGLGNLKPLIAEAFGVAFDVKSIDDLLRDGATRVGEWRAARDDIGADGYPRRVVDLATEEAPTVADDIILITCDICGEERPGDTEKWLDFVGMGSSQSKYSLLCGSCAALLARPGDQVIVRSKHDRVPGPHIFAVVPRGV